VRHLACDLASLLLLPVLAGGPLPGGEITLKGVVLNNAHTGEKEKSMFLCALDGPAEIKVEVGRRVPATTCAQIEGGDNVQHATPNAQRPTAPDAFRRQGARVEASLRVQFMRMPGAP
jgi:hypothetical protein